MQWAFVLGLAVLLTGSAYGIIRTAEVKQGDAYTFTVVTYTNTVERCYLKNPLGQVIDFAPGDETSSTDKYTVEQGNILSECELTVTNMDKDDDGTWEMYFTTPEGTGTPQVYVITVILNEISASDFIIQNDINIIQGADLYLHLNFGITAPETCKLYGPTGAEFTTAEADALYPVNCGYIVRNVNQLHTGTWIIEYGVDTKIRGSVTVHVLESETITVENLHWNIGESVDITLGPENAVYCKIEDPFKHIVYDNFGPCKIALDRVNLAHQGLWTMNVGVPGSVVLRTVGFYVSTFERHSNPLVSTRMERIAPSVMITCSVPAEHEVNSCTFRSPHGETVVAAHGVAEDGYMFNGSFVNNYQSEAHSSDCTLRLVNPSVADLGIWRCGLLTTTGTYYGYITVLCPFLMSFPEVAAAVVSEPEIQAVAEVSYEEEEPAVLSCSIPGELRYCYFRARNGSIFSVFPTMSSSLNYEYVGAGLDAGECGIRFKNGLAANEGGAWSCHVGLVNTTAVEQRATINVEVRARMTVQHYWSDTRVMVAATVHEPYTIDYCRFVRIDGHGFTTDHVPEGYALEQSLADGHCTLAINDPNMLDIHPWTVAVKFTGLPGEVAIYTTESLFTFPAASEPNIANDLLFWVLIVFVGAVLVMVGIAVIPKKNREWTRSRAAGVRDSFRNSWDRTFNREIIREEEKEKGQIKV